MRRNYKNALLGIVAGIVLFGIATLVYNAIQLIWQTIWLWVQYPIELLSLLLLFVIGMMIKIFMNPEER